MNPPESGEHQRLVDECSLQFHRAFHVFWENASTAWLDLDLSITQLRNLIILSLRGPQHVGQLAAALGVSEPSASQIVDRLAQRALIRRDADQSDRRRIMVSITAEGEHLLDSVRTSRSIVAEGLLDRLDDDALRALAVGTRALADAAGAGQHPGGECGLAVTPGEPAAGEQA
jgi:DNA-binding MarR family transcriptional regulator